MLGVQGQAPLSPAPAVSFALAKAQFLSTETPSGLLTIANPADVAISYDPFSVFLAVRNASGNVNVVPLFRRISIHGGIPIKPHETRTFPLTLPSCEVLSDPCTESVALKLYLRIDGKSRLFETSERTYALLPDPNATFQADGLRDNRPLFIARGEASGALLQRDLEIAFQFLAPENKNATDAPEAVKVTSIFAQRGLRAEHRFLSDRDGFQVRILLRNQGLDPSVSAAISDALREFGPSVKLVSTEFAPDSSDVARFVPAAAAAAQESARRSLGFFGDGDVTAASGPNLGDFVEVQTVRGEQNPQTQPFRPFVPTDWSSSDERSSNREPIVVRVRDTKGFSGPVPLSGLAFGNLRATQYTGRDPSDLAVLFVRARIGADRPEIYAVAQSNAPDADRLGYQPRAVAIYLALQRVRSLAAGLGASVQWVSLVAEYPRIDLSSRSALSVAGVAMAPAGSLDGAWQRLLPTPSPGPTSDADLHAVIAVGTPAPAIREPFRFVDLPPYVVPIELPQWQTRLVVREDMPVTVPADRVRLSVKIDPLRYGVNRSPPAPATMVRILRNHAFVEDVALQTTGGDFPPIGYQILMKTGERSAVATVVDDLRRAYRSWGVQLSYSVKLAVADCDTPVAQAQQSSLDAALRSAIARAQTSGTVLRHLVIVAALPVSLGEDETCDKRARPEALDVANDPELSIPSGTLSAHAPIELTFRTGAAPSSARDTLAVTARPRFGGAHVLGDERQR